MSQSSNLYLEGCEKYIKPPDIKDLQIKNPDDYIAKLDEIIAPKERLKKLLISTVNLKTEPTHEALWLRKFILAGFTGGFFAGVLVHSKDIHSDYIRQHNASVFDNKYVGNRHFWDTLAYRCAGRGFRYGTRAALVTSTAALIGISSITYRNKLHLPDWLIGSTALGALSRLWLGPRAMAAGAVIWLAGGTFIFGFARLLEKATGISLSEMEYLNHKEWLDKRQSTLNRNHLLKEDSIVEFIKYSMNTDGPR